MCTIEKYIIYFWLNKNYNNMFNRKINILITITFFLKKNYYKNVLSLNLLKMFKEIENNLNKTQTFVNFYEIKKIKMFK